MTAEQDGIWAITERPRILLDWPPTRRLVEQVDDWLIMRAIPDLQGQASLPYIPRWFRIWRCVMFKMAWEREEIEDD